MRSPTEREAYFGLLVEFDSPQQLLAAADVVREIGLRNWDTHSPFPIHGIERALGLRPSPLGWPAFIGALGGAVAGIGLQWWTSAAAYPLVVSGKPFFSWPAFVPIAFELAVLGGAVSTLGAFLYQTKLPRLHHPLFENEAFERATDDGFFLSLAADAKTGAFDRSELTRKFEDLGAKLIERWELPA